MAIQHSDYTPGTITKLLETDFVLPQTKKVLQQRLEKKMVDKPTFFSEEAFEVVKAVCNRLIPQKDHVYIDLAGILDTHLSENNGNGWRYNAMPPDQESFEKGVKGIDDAAEASFKKRFTALDEIQQDEILTAVQNGNVAGAVWQRVPANLFFEELLSRLVEIYYSHPLAKDTIGDVSFADAKGWQHIQLNEKEEQEPMPIGGTEQ